MRVSRVVVPLVAACAAATMTGTPASAAPTIAPMAAAAVAKVGFNSSAWGTIVTALDKTITSGATSSVSVACTSATGLDRRNSLATVNLPVVGRTGAVSTRVTTAGASGTTTTTSTSQIAGVNLLGGAVVADAITVSATAKDVSGVASGSGSTSFAGLKILGQSFSANVAPNSKVALVVAGKTVGSVTLNYQGKGSTNGVYASSARGIMISLLAGNPFGLPGATTVSIGGANAGVSTPRVATSGGSGWGLSATTLGGAVSIGRQPSVGIACYGGKTSGSLATLTRDPLISTGTTTVSTSSAGSATTATSMVKTTIAGPRILAGLISADAIVAEAHAARTPAGAVATSDRSSFVGLKILGLPAINSNVAPNTKIEVPGLGSVTLRKVTKTARGIEIVMLEIKLEAGIAGLPTGTVVQLGGANATVNG